MQALSATGMAAGYGGDLAFSARNITTGKAVAWHADKRMPTASCIKLPMLAALMAEAERGAVSLEQTVTLRAGDQVGGSGVLKHLSPGMVLSLRDVATLMIVLSDNTATNIVADLIGVDTVNAHAAGFGLADTILKTRVDFDAIGSDIRNFAESTPADFAVLLEAVARGTLVSAAASAAMKDMLSRQHYLDLLPRSLPYNPYARDLGARAEVEVAGKTGFYPGFRADALIVDAEGQTLVMAAFAYGDDMSFLPDNAIAAFMGRLGRQLFDELLTP